MQNKQFCWTNAGQSNVPRLDWNHQKDEKSCAEHGSVQDHAQDSQPNFHMSLGGAVRYVNKIAEEMMEMSETKEVILITGYANSRCDKDPLIKINLLQKFPQNVREDPNNGGRLIFPAKFNFSNGYVT
ncbi:hypothetical protein L3Y34_012956 [Caenorhabditis briggsae]|uniref:Uncharacterized protein n=1 Tax=Caenorhabditis briggsae TaxID=6238 RepID=A0AAE8ZVL5_CAEBR|nr:hypothetical protein L3Y34_012956 [Caenorhabditis briggsae]